MMELKPGTRLRSRVSEAEVIVVRAPSSPVDVGCGGISMAPGDEPGERSAAVTELDEPTLLGKRYVDEHTGLELLCVKAGPGVLTCEGRVMPVKDSKPLPSSD